MRMTNDSNPSEDAAETLSGGATDEDQQDQGRQVDAEAIDRTLQDAEGGMEGSALDAGDA
jgi:hypothetical protein